jgi:hypothetical protein
MSQAIGKIPPHDIFHTDTRIRPSDILAHHKRRCQPCDGVVPIDQAAAIQADAAVTREFLILRAARVLGAAIAQADAGDLPGALTRLQVFLALPAVAQATAPDLRAARRRVKEYLHQLEDEGFTRMNRKQMLYSSREWSGKTSRKPAEE